MARDLVFVGTYTDAAALIGRPLAVGEAVMGMTGLTGSAGLHVFERDAATGALAPLLVAPAVNPSFLILDEEERFLFAVNELSVFGGASSGAVSSFALDRASGALRFISQVPTGGAVPCHLSVAPDRRHLLVANYAAGSIAVVPLATDGTLSPPIDVHQDAAVDERQPHAHFITPDPERRFVLATDVGTDRVSTYRQQPETGRLVPTSPPWGETHKGGSPRHLAFSPDGRYVFVNGEADMTLSVFRYDAATGGLSYVKHVSTVPADADLKGASTANILVHPNGRFVYVSNRGLNTLAGFRFDRSSETLELVGFTSSHGTTPRHFQIDPSGRWLYAANQNSDTIEAFAIDQETGALAHVSRVAAVPAPVCILFTKA